MKKTLSLILLFFFITRPLIADDKGDAEILLKDTVRSVMRLLNDKAIDKEKRRKRIMDIIESVFDFKLMAKLTLGKRYWPRLKKDEKSEFVKLFTRQLENTYYGETELMLDEKIEFSKPKQVKRKVHILTTVFPKDKRLTILYKMYKKKGKWKIYDAEIQGVSIISSFRAQYSQFLKTGTVKDFLEKIREKDRALKSTGG